MPGGFYHKPTAEHADRCVCFACESALYNWDPDDDPWAEHCKWYPNCPFVLGKATKNMPVATAEISSDEGDAAASDEGAKGKAPQKTGYSKVVEAPTTFKKGGLNEYVQQLKKKESKPVCTRVAQHSNTHLLSRQRGLVGSSARELRRRSEGEGEGGALTLCGQCEWHGGWPRCRAGCRGRLCGPARRQRSGGRGWRRR